MSYEVMSDEDVARYAEELKGYLRDEGIVKFAKDVYGSDVEYIHVLYDRHGRVMRVRGSNDNMPQILVNPRSTMLREWICKNIREGYIDGRYCVGEEFQSKIEALYRDLLSGEDASQLEAFVVSAMKSLPSSILGVNLDYAAEEQHIRLNKIRPKHPGFQLYKKTDEQDNI